MSVTGAVGEQTTGRGRPQKRDGAGVETAERLLDAATAACVEHGFEATTVSDIATRAGIKTPSIYNHYSSKSELLVAVARHAFDRRFSQLYADDHAPVDVIRYFTSDELRDTRRLVVELHSAATRHPDVADLLAEWHSDAAAAWAPFAVGSDPESAVKAFFVLLLGLCHLDDLASVPASAGSFEGRLDEIVATLFTDEAPPCR
jgi:AcrR family transcriptional regulator